MPYTNLLLYIFLSTLPIISSYKICIVGASSGLGKELVYQSTNKSDNNGGLDAILLDKKVIVPPPS